MAAWNTGSGQLHNEFSWSHSRNETFKECLRALGHNRQGLNAGQIPVGIEGPMDSNPVLEMLGRPLRPASSAVLAAR